MKEFGKEDYERIFTQNTNSKIRTVQSMQMCLYVFNITVYTLFKIIFTHVKVIMVENSKNELCGFINILNLISFYIFCF